ncbi:DNZ54_00345 family protein [Citrobacter sp. Cpo091]|uniref:DNZ54_00345 family protein n=1 Tax=Citrobacter sp. Cpo091 TaxID=2985140 RepID=UPI00257655D6|nr:DNZ54_00345 family protein [Citrobacter sp. Cpo091]MDM2835721.1 DNZ54_00345 family protein [Citrobacter sp. Cpo091]
MKKWFKWIFDISLLVMISLGFMYPHSFATTVVAIWAWFGVGVCATLVCVGFACQILWKHAGKTGFSDIARKAFGLDVKVRLRNQLRFVVVTALITACLLNAGQLSTSLCYLAAMLSFRFLRSVFLLLTGNPLCRESSV